MKNFQGNYIKRISFYAGLIAFFVALGFSIFTYFRDTLKEGESLIENAKSSLTPYIKWYQEDSSKELERYRNLSKAEFEKLDVDLIIEKNLQDIKNIFEDVDILTRFILPYEENGTKKTSLDGTRVISKKMYIISALFEKQRFFDSKNTYFILNNPRRYQFFLDFQNSLETQIKKYFSDKKNLKKTSLDRIKIYYFSLILCNYALTFVPILGDIQENICQINKSIIQKAFSQYHFIQDNAKLLLDTFEEKENSLSKAQKEFEGEIRQFFIGLLESINKEQSTIQAIQSNLEKCK